MIRGMRVGIAVLVLAVGDEAAGQTTDTLRVLQLGEGRWQPNGKPLAIPHASPRLGPPLPAAGEASWSVRVARSVMRRNPQVHRRWDYTAGVVLGAIERVGMARGDTAMLAYVKRNMDRWVRPDGTIDTYDLEEYNIDHVAPGQLLFGLHARTGDARYRKAADLLRQQLRTHPRTAEGGFWHKKIYPHQMWLDGLFMGAPFYARYARVFGEPAASAAFDDVARQYLLMARHAHDPRSNLMHHAWDAERKQPWADSTSGLSRHFWGRAIGWYMLGVVEVLDFLPSDHPDRGAIIGTLQGAAKGVANVQDPVTGLWWDVLDQPNRAGNYLEASASSMFAYALAKGARLGYLEARYRTIAERAFGGIIANLVRENGNGTVSLINIVQVSGLGGARRRDGSYRDGSYEYYISEPVVTDDYKGVGPFILAALELGR